MAAAQFGHCNTIDPAMGPALAGTVLESAFPSVRAALQRHTADDGLDCAEVRIRLADLWIPAYVARPAGAHCRGVVIVVHDAFGPHAQLQDTCRRLAHLGSFAILPAFFAREAPEAPQTIPAWVKLAKAAPDARTLDDLARVSQWAAHASGSTAPPVIMGFCWGGRIAWLAAARAPLAAAVAWYGYLRNYASGEGTLEPVDVAADVRTPVLGLYGGSDEVIPLADVEIMQTRLASGASGSRLRVFPGAGHAFFSDHRAEHHPPSAAAAWIEACAWLETAGTARSAAQ